MNSSLVRHVIVGLGSIGKRHARLLIKQGCQVAGVDPFLKEDVFFTTFPDLDSADAFEPDMIWLCTPTSLHAGQACEVIEKGYHLFIEKPVSHDLASAEKILKTHAQKKYPAMIWVGCNMRFHPAVIELKRFLEKAVIGRPLIFNIHFSHWLPYMRPDTDYRQTYAAGDIGGGILLDDIHDIDLALWLAGPAAEVAGFSARSGMLDMASEDVAHISIRHREGAFSNVHMDFLRKDKSRGIQVIGETGSLEWRSYGKNPEKARIRLFRKTAGSGEIVWEQELTDFDAMFERQWEAMNQRVKHPEKYDDGLVEGINALRVISEVKRPGDSG